ncbi:hypothetical protein GCM10007874_21870 [Labrys miyagiensis]|uniref:Transposase n=1 Tax=Labrys miyagiensis TaxID=346912 RepID=A0ABQ6CGZ2_9HYPH|nr:hypothetical protein GCM10007874_21870 [Labrys miyagiensis]
MTSRQYVVKVERLPVLRHRSQRRHWIGKAALEYAIQNIIRAAFAICEHEEYRG